MSMYKLFLVFAVFNHAATSSYIDKLQESIRNIKNETGQVELSNDKLREEIKDQGDQFESDFLKLKGIGESENEELENVTAQVADLLLKVQFLYVAREALNITIIPAEKLRLLKVEYGLKWMREEFALLEKRSSDGDQLECLRILDEQSQQENVTIVTHQRMLKTINPYKDEIEAYQLELSNVMAHLKMAHRTHNQLALKLASDKAVFVDTLNNLKAFNEDVENNVEKAKTVLAKFEEDSAVLSKEVEELKKELEDLEKTEKVLRAEAVKVKSDVNMYEKAILCYSKYEQFAAEDEITSHSA